MVFLPVPLGITLSLGDGSSAKTSATLIVVISVFISHLPTGFAPTVLAALFKTRIQVGSDDSLVELGATDILHAVESILVSVVLHEAETAGGLVKSIQSHDQTLDLAALGEEFVYLLLRGVE